MASRARTSLVVASARIFAFSLGEMLRSRRTLFMAVVVGAAVTLAVGGRLLAATGTITLRVNGSQPGGVALFGTIVWLLFVRFVVPVLGVFYGTGIVADEVEDRTITYLFSRPIPRGAVVLGKYLAYLVCTGLVVLPAVVVVYFALVPFAQAGTAFPLLLQDLGVMALGLAAYGAFFALLGTVIRRPLVVGLLFAFGWEQFALALPGYLRRGTLTHYLQALVPHPAPMGGAGAFLQTLFGDRPEPVLAILALLGAVVVCLALAIRAVDRREYVLEQ